MNRTSIPKRMAYDYDALYANKRDALGAPFKEFVDFFEQYQRPTARVLDLGCGQGRDALFIARAGHSVVAVDQSPNGIKQIEAVAAAEKLTVRGVVADLLDYQAEGKFDVVVIDRTLHMLDAPDQLDVLSRVLSAISASGWVLIADERKNLASFLDVFSADRRDWNVKIHKKGFLFVQEEPAKRPPRRFSATVPNFD